MEFIKTKKQKLALYLFLIILVSIFITLLGLRVSEGDIQSFVERAGIWSPVAFIVLLVLTQVIAPLSATPAFFAGYVLFQEKLQIYTYFAFLISSAINFWIARRWGRALVTKLVGKKDIEKVDEFTKDYGVKVLIFLRVFQGHLADFVSYAYGLTNMKFQTYFIVSVITPIPWILIWKYFIFPRIDNVGDFSIWFLLTLVPFLIISWFYYRYKKK